MSQLPLHGLRQPGLPFGTDGPAGLPPEAYAAALATLPRMGPARLAAVLRTRSPEVAWADVLAYSCSKKEGAGSRWTKVVEAIGSSAETIMREWHSSARRTDVAEQWQRIVSLGVGVALHGNPGYPVPLADDIEPPTLLFHQGSPEVVSGPRVAVVGTRRCSSQGRGIAFELGRDLASAGVAVVSGLASGIDAAAHRGALFAASAPPIGVVATGVDVVYPHSNRELWSLVAEAGVILGEAPPGTRPERWRFPARNRIIAALADVVVVVESHAKGGALYTVDEADRRAVDVMAVPGSLRSPASAGTNNLLAEGRPPIRDAGDVLMTLGLASHKVGDPTPDPRPQPSAEDEGVLEEVGWQPTTLDQLVLRTGRHMVDLVASLGRLTEAGWIAQRGSWYERVASQCR
jgi:DNA processing protein